MILTSLAFIQHSAGTTGLQKGVALTHAAVLRQIGHLAEVLRIDSRDRIYSWLPLYHDMGLIACFHVAHALPHSGRDPVADRLGHAAGILAAGHQQDEMHCRLDAEFRIPICATANAAKALGGLRSLVAAANHQLFRTSTREQHE